MRRRDITKAIPHFISLERKKLQESEKGKSDHELMTKEVLARGLMEVCIERAAKKEDLTVDFFKKLSPGKEKRMLIDDVTVLVLDLEDQTNKKAKKEKSLCLPSSLVVFDVIKC